MLDCPGWIYRYNVGYPQIYEIFFSVLNNKIIVCLFPLFLHFCFFFTCFHTCTLFAVAKQELNLLQCSIFFLVRFTFSRHRCKAYQSLFMEVTCELNCPFIGQCSPVYVLLHQSSRCIDKCGVICSCCDIDKHLHECSHHSHSN